MGFWQWLKVFGGGKGDETSPAETTKQPETGVVTLKCRFAGTPEMEFTENKIFWEGHLTQERGGKEGDKTFFVTEGYSGQFDPSGAFIASCTVENLRLGEWTFRASSLLNGAWWDAQGEGTVEAGKDMFVNYAREWTKSACICDELGHEYP